MMASSRPFIASAGSTGRVQRRQRGAALFMGMVFTLCALLLTLAAMFAVTYQQRVAVGARERELAFQAADAALRDAELSIMCKTYASSAAAPGQCVAGAASPVAPACLPGCGSGPPAQRFAVGFETFVPNPGSGPGRCPNGFCTPAPGQVKPSWQDVDWNDTAATSASAQASTVPIGYFTRHPDFGRSVVPGIDPLRQPRFLIEAVPATCDPKVQFCTYRITAKGWGNSPLHSVMLQELFRPW